MTTVITGSGLAIVGAQTPADLLGPASPETSPVEPAARLGKKGLRYLDRATQLALAAAHDALRDAGLVMGEAQPVPNEPGLPARAELTAPAESLAVVASSNFGNVDAVCEVVTTVAKYGSTRLTSPMMAPRLSSNVVASEVAIRFGLRGPNLMLCNGSTSGLDAVQWARNLLVAGRARHVVVVGTEPENPEVRALIGDEQILDGAAAIVLEVESVAIDRHAAVYARLGNYARAGSTAKSLSAVTAMDGADVVAAWFVAENGVESENTPRHDLSARWGSASGALGVLQCVAAVGHFAAGGAGPVCAISGDDGDDATAALLLHAPTGAEW
jgi:3-oxoacyl-[acyl-carrier-protein] synthase II